MGVKVVSSTTASSTTFVRLRAAVAVADSPVAAVSYALPAAQIAYVDLALGAILDTTGRFRFIPQTVVLTDSTAFVLSKPFSDIVAPPDAVSVSALKVLADGFAMNDGSEAVDGSVYSLAKGIQNVAFVSDATATAALKLLQDTQALQDLVAKTAGKSLADVFSLTDDETVAALKGLSDSVAMQDTVATLLLFIRDFSDTLTVADADSRVFTLPKAELITVADDDVIAFAKGLAHSITATDFSPLLVDKPLVEAVAVADADVLLFSLSRVESTTVTDDGIVSVQDYCGLDYFVEDYVGLSQSF